MTFLESLWAKIRGISIPTSAISKRLPPNRVVASSFADPKDIEAFRRCKANGGTDMECFKVGDNGIGVWGRDTTGPTPMCALPPDDMEIRFGEWRKAKNAKVRVRANGHEVVCILADRMPWKKNIKNEAGIDLNPAAAKSLRLSPPFKVQAEWEWV